MDVVTILSSIGSAFGLSASAGLNAYIPLLVVALTARFTNWITLSAPYDALESWPVIIVLSVLLMIEILVDKIPAVDTANDLIQTAIRPTAGALLFAAQTNTVDEMSPVLAVIAGILFAGSVHATKTAVRPAVTATTGGMGNWAVSIIEDVVAVFASILAILLPLFIGVMGIFAILLVVRYWWKRRNRLARR